MGDKLVPKLRNIQLVKVPLWSFDINKEILKNANFSLSFFIHVLRRNSTRTR